MTRSPWPAPAFEWVDLPTGPQPLPEWVKGARVDWMPQYANPPSMRIMVTSGADEWPGKRWRREGDALYAATHEDGRADFLSASGEPRLEWLRAKLPLALPITPSKPYMGNTFWGVEQVRATPPTDGFGGRHFRLMMGDGEPLVLRGAWFGGKLPGYWQTSYHIQGARRYRHQRSKWDTTGGFGLYLREDLWLRILARFCPECRCARVTINGLTSLEPVAGHWDEPKHWIQDRERAARLAARAAA